jgi:peptidoglycan/LPS O-acetylase OafA/YrhL
MAQIVSWLPGFFDVFAVGMLFAVLSAWRASGGRLAWPVDTLGRVAGVCWLLALQAYWVSQQFHNPVTMQTKPTAFQDFGIPTFTLLAAALLVYPAVFGPQDVGLVRRFLRTRVLVFLGLISYGVYLWHDTVFRVVRDELGAAYLVEHPVVSVAVVLAGSIALGYANHRLIERPIAHLGRPRAARSEDGSPPST